MLIAVVGDAAPQGDRHLRVDPRRHARRQRPSASRSARRIPMTKMPERIALSHSFGGLATALVGVAEYLREAETPDRRSRWAALGFETFLGFLTFTGSIMAFGKLQGFISGAPVTWKGQNFINIGLFFGVARRHRRARRAAASSHRVFFGIARRSGLALGVMAVLPIGGADMPVVISLLNSYAGLAACATGLRARRAKSSSSPARSTARPGSCSRCS